MEIVAKLKSEFEKDAASNPWLQQFLWRKWISVWMMNVLFAVRITQNTTCLRRLMWSSWILILLLVLCIRLGQLGVIRSEPLISASKQKPCTYVGTVLLWLAADIPFYLIWPHVIELLCDS
jgi:hypothetical protein